MNVIQDQLLLNLADSIGNEPPLNNFSIFYGDGGVYLALDYLSKQYPEEAAIAENRQKYLENTLENLIESDYPNLTFSIGCVGFLSGLIISESADYDYEDLFKPIDRAMLNLVNDFRSKDHPYDPFKGILGALNYLRFRKEAIGNNWVNCLNEMVAYFDETKVPLFDGITWLEDKRKDVQHEKEKTMFSNLGLAHGKMAILYWLGLAYKETKSQIALTLINEAIAALVSVSQDYNHPRVCFPSVINKDKTYNGSDIAWCYGDLSAGIVLSLIGKVTNAAKIQNLAKKVALNAAKNVLDLPTDGDTCLCHGQAGNAYMLNLLSEFYAEEKQFSAAKNKLLEELCSNSTKNEAEDFKCFQNREFNYEKDEMELKKITNMLNGEAGIALALIGMKNNTARGWDKLMLLSY